MQLPRLAVKRPITTAMLLISVLVLGGIAIARLPLAYLPEIDVPFIGVQIPYPNSNPKEIEREIIKPVEEVLSTLAGVKTLNSTASADSAEFFLEFDWATSSTSCACRSARRWIRSRQSCRPRSARS